MKIEFCQICEQELSYPEADALESILEDAKEFGEGQMRLYNDKELDNETVVSLEKKGFVVTHETDEDLFLNMKIHTGLMQEETDDGLDFYMCHFICKDFHNHKKLMEKK